MDSIKTNLDPTQFGNIKGVSTTHCLIDILHTIHTNAELSKSVSSVLLTDFSKAFDHIDHTIAISSFLNWEFHFISFHLLFHRVRRKSSYKTKQTLKMQTCSNDTMITQDTVIKVKPVDSTPCRITKCGLHHNQVDLLKVLPTNKQNIYFK